MKEKQSRLTKKTRLKAKSKYLMHFMPPSIIAIFVPYKSNVSPRMNDETETLVKAGLQIMTTEEASFRWPTKNTCIDALKLFLPKPPDHGADPGFGVIGDEKLLLPGCGSTINSHIFSPALRERE